MLLLSGDYGKWLLNSELTEDIDAMKYMGTPTGMWLLFNGSFRKQLCSVFGYDTGTANAVMSKAKVRYKEIIRNLPEFEKGDRFKSNIVSCAMLAATILSMPKRPDVDKLIVYYRQSMMIPIMERFCRMSGKRKFSGKDIAAMKQTAVFKAADRNPYSWNMEYIPYADGSGYEARFTKCGICILMQELGLFDLVPAMCRLDYTMSEAGGASRFVREHTIAEGDSYCDCGYKKRTS